MNNQKENTNSLNNEINYKYDDQTICGNCGKIGHIYRNCNKPITSYGIICFRNNTSTINIYKINNINYNNGKKYSRKSSIINNNYTKKNYNLNNFLTSFISYPEIILIQRKHTIGFMEFIRGKYDINNNEYLIQLFNMMTLEEKDNILNIQDYDILRNMLGNSSKHKNYKKEYYDGKNKFSKLIENNKLNEIINNSNNMITWDGPEWGIPKGRRNQNETDLECATREFLEETGLNYNDIIIYQNIIPLEEIYTGINNILYKHVYFIARLKENNIEQIQEINIPEISINSNLQINYINITDNLTIDNNKPEQFNEISNIKWCNFEECKKLIRPYYINKINIIKKAFQMIKNLNGYFE